jgi:hypothetical protein
VCSAVPILPHKPARPPAAPCASGVTTPSWLGSGLGLGLGLGIGLGLGLALALTPTPTLTPTLPQPSPSPGVRPLGACAGRGACRVPRLLLALALPRHGRRYLY